MRAIIVGSSLITNLEGKLARNDPRRLAFGLNMPATSSTPGKPVNLTAHTDDTGAVVVQCEAVPLATRYRWRMLIVGVQTEYQLAASTTEPLASISDVSAGQAVQLIVQAVNGVRQARLWQRGKFPACRNGCRLYLLSL